MNKILLWIRQLFTPSHVLVMERRFDENIIHFSNNGFTNKTQILYKNDNTYDYGVALVETLTLKQLGIIDESKLEKPNFRLTYFRYEPQRKLFYIKMYNDTLNETVVLRYALGHLLNIGFINPSNLMEYLAIYPYFDYQKVIEEFDVRLG